MVTLFAPATDAQYRLMSLMSMMLHKAARPRGLTREGFAQPQGQIAVVSRRIIDRVRLLEVCLSVTEYWKTAALWSPDPA